MYAGGGTGSMYIMSGAGASYNGMVASIEHRMSSSFVFLANYTWSHCIDISDNAADVSTITIQNPANIKGDKGSCGFDFRDIFNTSVVASSHFSLHGWKGQSYQPLGDISLWFMPRTAIPSRLRWEWTTHSPLSATTAQI
jgi:hypothetical protein